MEWAPTLVGYLVIVAASIAAIATAFSAIAFVFERRELARDKASRERCRAEIALAIQVDSEMFERYPDVRRLLKEVALEINAKKSGGCISLDNALEMLDSNSKVARSK